MKRGIGEKSIRNLEAPKAGNRIEWDERLAGFGVRITAAGATSFVLDYYVAGRRRRYTNGRHPEMTASVARERAEELRVRIRDGFDPMQERVQSRVEPTVAGFVSGIFGTIRRSQTNGPLACEMTAR